MIISSKVGGPRSDGDYDYVVYWIRCDGCGKDYGYDESHPLLNFSDVVTLKKRLGFLSTNRSGAWREYCPECRKKMQTEDYKK